MSPRLHRVFSVLGWALGTETPARMVHASLLRMKAQRIPLRWGEPGVTFRPLVAGWHLSHARGVNVVGAVLLAFPPELTEDAVIEAAAPDPIEHAARTLGVQHAFVAGLDDGWHREPHPSSWLRNIRREDYLAGYETGMEARFRATTVCACGVRRFLGAPVCATCAG
jgi:hypothetical protein